MQELLDIEGVDGPICSLLEAVGYTDLDSLKSNKPEVIHAELVKANKMLMIMEQSPSLELVESWCAYAPTKDEDLGIEDNGVEPTPKFAEYIAPVASPLSEDFVEKQEVELDQLPRVTKFSGAAGENEALLDSSEKRSLPKSLEKKVQAPVVSKKVEVNIAKVITLDDYRSNGSVLTPHEKRDDANNVREAKAGTNAGVDPNSEKYIRGVLHNDAQRTYLGAWGYILACLLLVGSIAPIIYIVLQRENYIWGWLTPVILFLALVVYGLVARKSSCPVCRQRQFVPKACRKHVRAHSWPLLGNMLATAWHLVKYKWFRCIFCGTSIRVKE